MPTLNYQIQDGQDDGFENNWTGDNSVTLSGSIEIGQNNTNQPFMAGFRFINIAVPQGALITAATLTLTGFIGGTVDLPDINVVGVLVSNFALFTGVDGDISSRTPISANVTVDFSSIVDEVEYDVPVTSIIQEIVSQAGWVSGNAIGIKVYGESPSPGLQRQRFYSYDQEPTLAAKLDITYIVPLPTTALIEYVTIKQVNEIAAIKALYMRSNPSLDAPAWAGACARLDSTRVQHAKLDIDRRADFASGLGAFGLSSRTLKAPGLSVLDITVKEKVGTTVYDWRGFDVESRVQCAGTLAGDLNNWIQIKRFCECMFESVTSSPETSASPLDNAETLLSLNASSPNEAELIRRVGATLSNIGFAGDPVVISPVIHNRSGKLLAPYRTGTNTYGLAVGNDINSFAFQPDNLPVPATENQLLLEAFDAQVVIASNGMDGYACWSDNLGLSWYASDGVDEKVTCLLMLSHTIVLAGTDNNLIYRSTDGGRTFSAINVADSVGLKITDIWIGPDDILYAVGHNTSLADPISYLAYSLDGGINWQRLSSATGYWYLDGCSIGGNIYVSAIVIADSSKVAAYVIGSMNGVDFDLLLSVNPPARDNLRIESCACGVLYAAYCETSNNDVLLLRNVNWGVVQSWEKVFVGEGGQSEPARITCLDANNALVSSTEVSGDTTPPLYLVEVKG